MQDNRRELTGKRVVVGLTGRTDSALAAFLLKKQGMQVIGISIVTVDDGVVPNPSLLPKCHIRDLESVKALCARLDIPFYATNSKPRFESEVIDRIVANKLTGKANSSCFYCSQSRMEILYEKMLSLEADFIATGHYAKVRLNLSSNEVFIHSNGDEASDQSFLLAGTPSHILEKLLLPLGDLSKNEIEKYARHFALPVSKSLEQEGFCFRTKESSSSILKKRLPKSLIRPGVVENVDSGAATGEHAGVVYHYITEKEPNLKSGGLDSKSEIVGYDYKSATIKVGSKNRLSFKGVQLTRSSFNAGIDKAFPFVCYVKFKYSSKFIKAELFFKNNDTVFLQFHEQVYPLIIGEVLVVYDSASATSKVLGWGLVGQRGEFRALSRVGRYERETDEKEGSGKVEPSYFRF